jgi:hypothetical protein
MSSILANANAVLALPVDPGTGSSPSIDKIIGDLNSREYNSFTKIHGKKSITHGKYKILTIYSR